MFANKIRNSFIWAAGGLAVWLIVLPIRLAFLRLVPNPEESSPTTLIWTFLGYPYWNFDNPANLIFAIGGILLQWLALAIMGKTFQQALKQLKTNNPA